MHFSFYGSLSYSSGQQSLYVMLFNVVNKPGDCWHNWLLQQLHVLNTQSNSCSSHHSNAASIRQVDIITNICCTLLHPIMTSRAYSKMTACYCKLILHYISSLQIFEQLFLKHVSCGPRLPYSLCSMYCMCCRTGNALAQTCFS